MSIKEMARRLDALPLNDGWARYVPRVPAPSSRTDPENAPPRRYENESSSRTNWTVVRYEGSDHSTTWDEDLGVGCLCDSTWAVGLKPGERQSPEFFGADCSLRHCPSGDDPLTEVDETDCTNKTAAGGRGVGKPGNICHVRSSGAAFSFKAGIDARPRRRTARTGARATSTTGSAGATRATRASRASGAATPRSSGGAR